MSDSVPSWVIRKLQTIRGLSVHLRSDGLVELAANGGSGTAFRVIAVPVLSRQRAQDIISHWRGMGSQFALGQPLVAVRHIASITRELLREHDMSWVEESTGICRISAVGLLVDTKISDPSHQPGFRIGSLRLRGRSGRIAEALLSFPAAEEIRLGPTAEKADVSRPLVSRVISRLTDLRLVQTYGAGPNTFWRVTDPGGILDLWATEEQGPTHLTSLYAWGRSPSALLEKLEALNQIGVRWALSGTIAANLYAPTLTTMPDVTFWVDSHVPATSVAAAIGGEIVDEGANIQMWQSEENSALQQSVPMKWDVLSQGSRTELKMVSRPRAYVETMLTGRQRAKEVASNLRERIMSDAKPRNSSNQ